MDSWEFWGSKWAYFAHKNQERSWGRLTGNRWLWLAEALPLTMPVDTRLLPWLPTGPGPRLSWYSLAGEMELGREPILSKNGDEDIGVCPCTTNIPRGCDHLIHWRRKGEDRWQAQKNTMNLIGLGEAIDPASPAGVAQPQRTLWTPATTCNLLSHNQTHSKSYCETKTSRLMLHSHLTGKAGGKSRSQRQYQSPVQGLPRPSLCSFQPSTWMSS